jgi:hypothetical protein
MTDNRSVLVWVVEHHWPTSTSGCSCGWSVLGHSFPEHLADTYIRLANDRLQQQIERLLVDRDAAKETGNVCHALHEEALAEVERLRAIEQAAHAWATAVENSEDDDEESEEYVDASHALYLALGRAKARNLA